MGQDNTRQVDPGSSEYRAAADKLRIVTDGSSLERRAEPFEAEAARLRARLDALPTIPKLLAQGGGGAYGRLMGSFDAKAALAVLGGLQTFNIHAAHALERDQDYTVSCLTALRHYLMIFRSQRGTAAHIARTARLQILRLEKELKDLTTAITGEVEAIAALTSAIDAMLPDDERGQIQEEASRMMTASADQEREV